MGGTHLVGFFEGKTLCLVIVVGIVVVGIVVVFIIGDACEG